ncbi:hypothetical protein D3C80_1331560 [compost metagenome]
MNKDALATLLRYLMNLRTRFVGVPFDGHSSCLDWGRYWGFVNALRDMGVITSDEAFRLEQLAVNANEYGSQPFPVAKNAGPIMTHYDQWQRDRTKEKPQAQAVANEEPEPVPAPASRRQLRLLCLLVPSRTGEEHSLPAHTLRALPPRADIQGRWALGLPAGLVLRETQARPPRPEVLERCLRQRATHALRAHPRTVRGLSHV